MTGGTAPDLIFTIYHYHYVILYLCEPETVWDFCGSCRYAMQEPNGRLKGAGLLVYSASVRLFSLVPQGIQEAQKLSHSTAGPDLSAAILIGISPSVRYNALCGFHKV